MYTPPQLSLIENLFEQKGLADPVRRKIYDTISNPAVKPFPHVSKIIDELMKLPDTRPGTAGAEPGSPGFVRLPKTDTLIRDLGLKKGMYSVPRADVPSALVPLYLDAPNQDSQYLHVAIAEYNHTMYVRVLLQPGRSKIEDRATEQALVRTLATDPARFLDLYTRLHIK